MPLVPGSPGAVDTIEEAQKLAVDIGFPLLVKAASGGAGAAKLQIPQMRRFESFHRPPSEKQPLALRFILNGTWITHAILSRAVADSHGNAVHLGERECPVRRHQKLLSEAPSPAITQTQHEYRPIAANATLEMGYLV